jgi:hypothetical protein
MFRLAKVLNSNYQYELIKLKNQNLIPIAHGCALTCTDGILAGASATSMPEYIAFRGDEEEGSAVSAMIVTENMVFKAEYKGDTAPYVGMTVGLAKIDCEMDAVCQNDNGKGTVIGIDDEKKLVYVRFRK